MTFPSLPSLPPLKRLATLLGGLAVLAGLASQPLQAAATGSYRVVGYMPDWQGDVNAVQYGKLTHVCYAFLQANSNGSLDMSGVTVSRLQQLTSLAHNNGTKVLISLGGWSNGTALTAAMRNSSARSTLASNCLNFISQYGLDGFDFDWEGPANATDAGYYSSFMQTMFSSLHPLGKLTTTAIATWYGDFVPASSFAYMDFANLMAYDNDGAQHSDYNFAVTNVNYWIGKGLPASKCVLGVPFYGYADASHSSEVAYSTVCANDPNAQNYDYSGGVYYNGIPTIQQKTNYVVSQNAGGIMIWELSEDATGSKSLLSAIYTILSGTNPTSYTLTASAGANGSISPSGSVSVASGGSKSFSIAANSGYVVNAVTVDGANVGAVTSYTFNGVTANHSISASFKAASSTYTITASAGSGGSISPSGAVSVTGGGSQSFTITPSAGYIVSTVTVDGASVGAVSSYAFNNVSAAHSISASFVLVPVSSNLALGKGASASSLETSAFPASQAVDGNTGTRWSSTFADPAWIAIDLGSAQSFNRVVLRWEAAYGKAYQIQVSNDNGTWTTVYTQNAGLGGTEDFSFAATSARYVRMYGTARGTQWGYSLFEFEVYNTGTTPTSYTLTASAGANGSISPAGSVTVNQGGSQSFTITPASGYVISAVTVDGASVGAVTSYTFSNVQAAHSISATFKAAAVTQYTLTASAGAGGSISPSGAVTVNQGASQTFSITPASGYVISAVTVDGASVGAVSSYTFSNVNAAHSISASFSTSSIPAWAPNVYYAVGALVTYNGATWKNVLAHTSNVAWYPGAPGLWFWEQQ